MHPVKKRRLYEGPSNLMSSSTAPPVSLSHADIIRKQRNKDEIRNLYDCYKKIRLCISSKNVTSVADAEQAYLSLITASRGCTSVQRIVAELVPKYASHCPTALEASVKVIIEMYGRGLAAATSRPDDGTAFDTARACVSGLADICHVAAAEAPTSAVIQGISSAVFLTALTFLVTSLDGKSVSDADAPAPDAPPLVRLSAIHAATLLSIFSCSPKDTLSACFRLLSSHSPEDSLRGSWFLARLTSVHHVGETCLLAAAARKDPLLGKWAWATLEEKKLSRSTAVEGIISVLRRESAAMDDDVRVPDDGGRFGYRPPGSSDLWVGLLCKSGVRFCTVHACSAPSELCTYSPDHPPEPFMWPAKLDMKKRTDVKNVKSTFHNTPPYKRVVCLLVPRAMEDHKGLLEFESYLKQRACAGVVRVPRAKPVWGRRLFILASSPDLCSMLSIRTRLPTFLISLVLPKEKLPCK